MTRTVDYRHRDALLNGVVDYVLSKGINDLSLRPLARGVGTSPRGLLYHFASKEDLIVKVLARLRERQQRMFGAMRVRRGASPSDVCRRAWKIASHPRYLNAYRLLFEIFALAVRDPKRYASFVHGAIDDWLSFFGEAALGKGVTRTQAGTFATVVLAGFRGFLLDLCATGARRRVDRAVDLWLKGLESIAPHWR